MPDPAFFDFVVNLVKLGGLGVGALIFVLAFLILFRNQAASADMARLRLSFLRWGFAFAVVALASSTATDLAATLRPASHVRLGVTISPDFAEAKLPPPQLYLMPAGTPLQPNTATDIKGDATLSIQVRGIVESVKGLSQSSETLLATNRQLTDALDKSSQVVEQAKSGPTPTPAASATLSQIPVLKQQELMQMKAAQSNIAAGLSTGDFKAAASNSVALNRLAVAAPGLRK